MLPAQTNMRNMKKNIALAGVALLLAGGIAAPGDHHGTVCPSLYSAAYAAEPTWLDDVNAASEDDTLAYGLYIGKPIQDVIGSFQGNGWKRADQGSKVIFTRNRGDYIQMIAIHPHAGNSNLVGSYRIRFHVKDKTQAENMYMQAEKNFSYNFGRPTFSKGTDNRTWVLNETFAIIVEYNEYNPKLPATKGHPYEVVIKREMGDYGQFLLPGQ